MRMAIAGIIILVILAAVGGAYRVGYSEGTAVHEAAANQVALKRAKAEVEDYQEDIALERALRATADAQVARVNAEAASTKAAIAEARAAAARQREKEQRLIAELENLQCPAPPKLCAWDCDLPPLPSSPAS